MAETTGERVVFVSLEHPNQDVVTGPSEYIRTPSGKLQAVLNPSVKFSNGRAVLDSIRDAKHIASLREHKDYGVHIKELNEKALEEKVKLNQIQIDQVACPHCRRMFPNLIDRNRHLENCDVKNRPEVIRSDESQSNSGASSKGGKATS